MTSSFIGINWGSTNLSAYLLSEGGAVVDRVSLPKGVTRIKRSEVIETLAEIAACWPEARAIYASGMIGSPAGWATAPYRCCPARLRDVAAALLETRVGALDCRIVPGLATDDTCVDPDVMRGEEVEVFGLMLTEPRLASARACVILPGTHTKWVQIADGAVETFFTSMSGELYDRLASQGLLSSIIEGEAASNDAFLRGVERGASGGAGLARLLFGVRAHVLRDKLPRADAASYARGLLIGAEIADAFEQLGGRVPDAPLPLLGNPALCALYRTALDFFGAQSVTYHHERPLAAAYLALHEFAAQHVS